MQVVLTQQKCAEALKGETPMLAHQTQVNKTKIMDKANNSII